MSKQEIKELTEEMEKLRKEIKKLREAKELSPYYVPIYPRPYYPEPINPYYPQIPWITWCSSQSLTDGRTYV